MLKYKFVVFGAGTTGKKIAELVGYDNISCFIDNFLTESDVARDLPLYNFRNFINRGLKEDEIIVVTPISPRDIVSIVLQLENKGLRWILPSDVGKMVIDDEAYIYESQNRRPHFKINKKNDFYIYKDRFDTAGHTGAYFWMDLWAAKKIFNIKPEIHFDIGSRIDGFISHLMLIGQKVKLIDIRPANLGLEGVDFIQADATNLDGIDDSSIESLSALCSPEHFGLGRYGDPIDPEACFKFFESVSRKMKKKGHVYICVPVGKEHVEFNAHRVFAPKTVIESFGKNMSLVEFSVTDDKSIIKNADIEYYSKFSGIGLFEFVKL